ncbi:hypothetical protein ACJJTC_006189 [Scirpophaga incertulas]
MSSKFPFSMESIPRQQNFVCLSLRLASVITALLVILYSVLALAECTALLGNLMSTSSMKSSVIPYMSIIGIIVIHTITLFLSAIMLVGAIQEIPYLIRPWVTWMSIQVMVLVLVFLFSSTMDMLHSFQNSSFIGYLIDALSLLIRFYMVMVVGNFYKDLAESQNNRKGLIQINSNEYWYEA